MKTYHHPASKFLVFVFVLGSLAAAVTSQAGVGSNDALVANNARLIVWRAADFGTILYLNVAIDGIQVTCLPRGIAYEAIVRPGTHVLTVSDTPCPYGKTRFTHRQVTFRRGETYTFTALWDSDNVVLETGAAAYLARQANWY